MADIQRSQIKIRMMGKIGSLYSTSMRDEASRKVCRGMMYSLDLNVADQQFDNAIRKLGGQQYVTIRDKTFQWKRADVLATKLGTPTSEEDTFVDVPDLSLIDTLPSFLSIYTPVTASSIRPEEVGLYIITLDDDMQVETINNKYTKDIDFKQVDNMLILRKNPVKLFPKNRFSWTGKLRNTSVLDYSLQTHSPSSSLWAVEEYVKHDQSPKGFYRAVNQAAGCVVLSEDVTILDSFKYLNGYGYATDKGNIYAPYPHTPLSKRGYYLKGTIIGEKVVAYYNNSPTWWTSREVQELFNHYGFSTKCLSKPELILKNAWSEITWLNPESERPTVDPDNAPAGYNKNEWKRYWEYTNAQPETSYNQMNSFHYSGLSLLEFLLRQGLGKRLIIFKYDTDRMTEDDISRVESFIRLNIPAGAVVQTYRKISE